MNHARRDAEWLAFNRPSDSPTRKAIVNTCNGIRDLLLEKNAKYGDSALNPKRVFSEADPIEQIKVRIDDKISRIQTTGFSAADEDTLQDLIGYLVLLKIAICRPPYDDMVERTLQSDAGFPETILFGSDDDDVMPSPNYEEITSALRMFHEWDDDEPWKDLADH